MPSTFEEIQYHIQLTASFKAYLQGIIDVLSLNSEQQVIFPILVMKYTNGAGDTVLSAATLVVGEHGLDANGFAIGGLAEVISASIQIDIDPDIDGHFLVTDNLEVVVNHHAPTPQNQYVEIIAVCDEDFTSESGSGGSGGFR